jgi:uncharacterized membrane protein
LQHAEHIAGVPRTKAPAVLAKVLPGAMPVNVKVKLFQKLKQNFALTSVSDNTALMHTWYGMFSGRRLYQPCLSAAVSADTGGIRDRVSDVRA